VLVLVLLLLLCQHCKLSISTLLHSTFPLGRSRPSWTTSMLCAPALEPRPSAENFPIQIGVGSSPLLALLLCWH
jgi:hypothetical protein